MVLTLSVRKESIRAWVREKAGGEARLVVNYKGRHDRLSVDDRGHAAPNTKALFLATHKSRFAITAVD